MENLNIKVGQVWLTRGGKAVAIYRVDVNDEYPVWGDDGISRTEGGFYLSTTNPSGHDLVSLDLDAGGQDLEIPPDDGMRQDFIGRLILVGLPNGFDPASLKEFIALYDASV